MFQHCHKWHFWGKAWPSGDIPNFSCYGGNSWVSVTFAGRVTSSRPVSLESRDGDGSGWRESAECPQGGRWGKLTGWGWRFRRVLVSHKKHIVVSPSSVNRINPGDVNSVMLKSSLDRQEFGPGICGVNRKFCTMRQDSRILRISPPC